MRFPKIASCFMISRLFILFLMVMAVTGANGQSPIEARVAVVEEQAQRATRDVTGLQKDVDDVRAAASRINVEVEGRLSRLEDAIDWNNKLLYLIISGLGLQLGETILSYAKFSRERKLLP